MELKLRSAPEVAGLLGIEVDTLYRYARAGRIRGLKVGKAWRFCEEDLREFLHEQRYLPSVRVSSSELLPDILRDAAAEAGAQGGILWRGAEASFADVNSRSDQLANRLLATGVAPGDRVVVLLPNCLEFIIGCFGIWKAGAILVAEDAAISRDNLRHILRDSAPAALIIDRSVAEQLDGFSEELKELKVVLVKDRTFALSGLNDTLVESLDAVLESEVESAVTRLPTGKAGDVVSITYTSGSTGKPKGVLHTHESWLAGAGFTKEYHGITRKDSIVIPLPLNHGLAFRQILAYTMARARILLASDIYQALKLMREHKPSAAVLVPAAVNILIDNFAPLLKELDVSLRYLEIGSASFAPERFEELRRLLPNTAIHLPYGLTEARVGFLKPGADGLLNRIAKVATGLHLEVIDELGIPVAKGVAGEIHLKGRGLMKGYRGQSAAEMAALSEHGFRTGDMAMIDKKGDVALLGRLDDMLKVGGHKVNPSEVEAVLKQHHSVAECAVVGMADPKAIFETQLHAFVVPRNNGGAFNEKDLTSHCRRHLESYKVPARIHCRNSLPKSPVGKILRHAIQTAEKETALSARQTAVAERGMKRDASPNLIQTSPQERATNHIIRQERNNPCKC
jgi:long-chain acyl-CoA synthetase